MTIRCVDSTFNTSNSIVMSRRIIIDELEFEVPYGKLAAKTWHEETDECKRVLALHGWMDNSGSFDNIMPHIKHENGVYIVALDLPGHGKSSQLPPGSSYSDMNIVMEIRRCLTELKWIQPVRRELNGDASSRNHMLSSKSHEEISDALLDDSPPVQKRFSIIGHSLGAGLGLFYASLFPNDVEEIVLLDFIKSRTTTSETLLYNTAETIDQFIHIVPSLSPFSSPISARSTLSANTNKAADKGQVVVSQEAAIIATIEAHKQLGVLTRDDATCLLRRSTVAVSTPPNSVIYSRDLRLQSMLNMREHWEVNKIMFARVRCHVISILAKNGLYASDPLFRDNIENMEKYLRDRAKTYYVQWMDADHYLHMNKPQKTAEFINKYLESPSSYHVITC